MRPAWRASLLRAGACSHGSVRRSRSAGRLREGGGEEVAEHGRTAQQRLSVHIGLDAERLDDHPGGPGDAGELDPGAYPAGARPHLAQDPNIAVEVAEQQLRIELYRAAHVAAQPAAGLQGD